MSKGSFTSIAALCLLLGSAAPALADATVEVELKTKDGKRVDGTVQLTKGEAKYTCSTKAGRCSMPAVPGGMYQVTVQRQGKPAPKPRQAMIPPAGKVQLVVSAD